MRAPCASSASEFFDGQIPGDGRETAINVCKLGLEFVELRCEMGVGGRLCLLDRADEAD
jgi:hypothetical protein